MSTPKKRSWHPSRWVLFIGCLAVTFMLAMMPLSQTSMKAQEESDKRAVEEKDGPVSVEQLAAHPSMKSVKAPEFNRPTGGNAAFVSEVEPNNTSATAQPLTGTNVRLRGNVQFNRVPTPPVPNDLDFYSFSGTMGDRVYAAVQTSFSSGGSGLSGDSFLELLDTNGTTILESDDEDGSFNANSSSIAGATLPSTGTFFIKVRHFSATPASEIQPYDLYLRLQSGSPTPETEPNNNAGPPNMPNPLPANGWVSGAIDPAPNPPGPDSDVYSIMLNAGDTIYLSLDANPERDGVTWNPRLGFGLFNGFFLLANDASVTSPNSEAFFFTVREAGTYLVYVDTAVSTPGPTITYHLSASVHAQETIRTCTTYTSTDVPKAIGPDPSVVTSTIMVPDNKRVGNLKVSLNITHADLTDLDVTLIAPDGNEVALFDDPPAASAGTTAPQIDLTLDDEAGLPHTLFGVNKSMIFQLDSLSRLFWFKNQKAMGTWTLRVFDDTTGDAGTLNGWSITVCEDPPIPTCPTAETTVYSSDFEANDGMFTHTGNNDEWERGLPTFAPITTCNSGVNCWKTDLDNTYNAAPTNAANVVQELVSPNIDLTMLTGQRITFEWAMKYQIEGAHWDHAYVEVREVGGGGLIKRVFEHQGPTMSRSVGSPSVQINPSAGWGLWQVIISEFAGKTVQLVFHLDNDDSVQFAGLAIDDVKVTACDLATCPTSLMPTSESYAGNGGMGSIAVTGDMGCNWTVTNNNPEFITVTSGPGGTGNGTVNYTVAANPNQTIRQGTITVGDLTFTVFQGINFADVPANDPFYTFIGKLSARGITLGCSTMPANFCPNANVTREQMAAFIIRAIGEFNPPVPAMQRFDDVPPTNVFYNFIDRMAVLGITVGCSAMPPLYCPTANVTREQMAAFIIRGIGEFNPPVPAMQRFDDVPPANPFYNFIERMGALGITSGCSAVPPLYCPTANVTRGQMAVFIINAFDL
jgi:subtilisin-like proprotein convertase family protein